MQNPNYAARSEDAEVAIVSWHYERNLIKGSTDKDQMLKLVQEVGELSDDVCKGKDVLNEAGDCIVVLLNILERNDYTLADAMEAAFEKIKNRTGKMIDGVFVKEEDNVEETVGSYTDDLFVPEAVAARA